jgi:hypothetical protein
MCAFRNVCIPQTVSFSFFCFQGNRLAQMGSQTPDTRLPFLVRNASAFFFVLSLGIRVRPEFGSSGANVCHFLRTFFCWEDCERGNMPASSEQGVCERYAYNPPFQSVPFFRLSEHKTRLDTKSF